MRLPCLWGLTAAYGHSSEPIDNPSALGVKQRFKTDYDPEQAKALLARIAADVEAGGSADGGATRAGAVRITL